MKRTLKKTPDIAENLIEEKPIKGKNISIYLNAENLRYLDEMCKLSGKGRSEQVQELIDFARKGAIFYASQMKDKNLLEAMRKMAGV